MTSSKSFNHSASSVKGDNNTYCIVALQNKYKHDLTHSGNDNTFLKATTKDRLALVI